MAEREKSNLMNVLEKILEEIEERGNIQFSSYSKPLITVEDVLKIIRSNMDDEDNDGWIPVEDGLPEDDDMRFYMCIVENHEEDLPMFCQYDSEYGFGFWHDMYDSVSLGFIDTEFRTNDELGYEKVIAWQPLPEPYKPKKDIAASGKEHIMSRFMKVE